jgi:hypothetical protein
MDRSAFVHSGIHPAAGFVFSAFATVALLLFPGAVQAAPQSLGLVATAEPVPMICDEDGCVVQLSSFCLQGDRKSPNFNTPYHVDGGTGLWLHLTDADGGHRTIPAEGLARFVSIRGYTSVEVGKQVTLFPEAIPGDPNPITPEEVAFAKGEARRLAASIFDSTEGLGHTISIIDRSINSLTSMSRLSDEERRDLWSRVAGAPLDTEPDARTRGAAQMFSECLDDLRRKMVFGLRNCLEGRRDEVLIRANVTLWNGLGTGS